jgi:DNA-binding transcriptional MocR family regulator
LTTSHTNNLASLYLSSLLAWSQLPTLLQLNSERLTASYRILAEVLRKWQIEFITPTHGLFLFAKLAKYVKTADEEKRFYDSLAVSGVKVGQGRFYDGAKGDFGWARIRFSLPAKEMERAVERIEAFFSQRGR